MDEATLASLASALAGWMGCDKALVDCESHGRDLFDQAIDTSRTVGWFTAIFPVLLERRGLSSPLVALGAVKEQFRECRNRGINYGLLRFTGHSAVRRALAELPQAQVGFNYFGHADLGQDETLFRIASRNPPGTRSPRNPRPWLLEVNCWIANGCLEFTFRYSINRHREDTIQRLATQVLARARELMNTSSSAQPSLAPSDFPLSQLNERQLAAIVAKVRKD